MRLATLAVVAWFPTSALAQAPYALVLEDTPPWGASTTMELAVQAITYDVATTATFPTTILDDYTMLFVSSCQSDALYGAFNARAADIDAFVSRGGFLAIHGCVYSCGYGTGAVFPQPPGGNVSTSFQFPGTGTVLQPADPLMLNVPPNPWGSSLAHLTMPATGGLADIELIEAYGDAVYFRRVHGLGNIAVGTITSEFGYVWGQDAGTVLRNEVTWGSQVGVACDQYGVDTDLDGVSDDCDRCEGFDDNLDADGDGTPDDCDRCPGSNDFLNADGDLLPDGCDNCMAVANDDQADADADLVGDSCDACPGYDDRLDADLDTAPDDCDICPGWNDFVDTDADLHPNQCDNCPFVLNEDQADADLDTRGDACDRCPGSDDLLDADVDGMPDDCDTCAGGNDFANADADIHADACDNCPGAANDDQADADGDTRGDACDRCPGFDDLIDADGDAMPDLCDNCVNDPNFNQNDADADGLGDACDICPNDFPDDTDGDGRCDSDDRCPGFDDQADADDDMRPDDCDNCPNDANANQADADGDGAGNLCDCEGNDPAIYPGAVETCDGLDNDCDGTADNDVPGVEWWQDADGDGFGDTTSESDTSCDAPPGFVNNADDCNDGSPQVNPTATEQCDGIDNDCDGVVDDPSCADDSAGKSACGCASDAGGTAPWMAVGLLAAVAARRRRSA